jgi:hypothetical protein
VADADVAADVFFLRMLLIRPATVDDVALLGL